MDLIQILKNTGLSEKEAKIYLVLLKFKEALPSTLAHAANIKRPTTYLILEQLSAKGLAGKVKKNKTYYYHPVTPHSLVEDQYKKFKELEDSLPELLNIHKKFAVTPQVTFFEGKNGIIHIMEDTLNASTGLLCWADVGTAANTLLKDYYPTYISKKVARKIWLDGVFCYDKTALRMKKFGQKELREVHLIPKEKFPFKNEINIYDDKVAIISHEDEIGVIIQNQNIADTQRSIFKLGFEYAKILEKDVLTEADLQYLSS